MVLPQMYLWLVLVSSGQFKYLRGTLAVEAAELVLYILWFMSVLDSRWE